MAGFNSQNVKVRIANVRFVESGNQVHCFLNVEHEKVRTPFLIMCDTADDMGMAKARYTGYRWRGDRRFAPKKASASNKYIYYPWDYEFKGTAVLKEGDKNDIEFAKQVAYKKAYRQAISFYNFCYSIVVDYVHSYTHDIAIDQIHQLAARQVDVQAELKDLIAD